MAHITEHHSEEKWERSDSDWGRIGFLISWDTIHIDKGLEWSQELGGLEVCWLWNRVVVVSRYFSSRVLVDRSLNVIFKLYRSPEVPYKALILPLHKIQSQVKFLLLGQEHFVNVNG